MVSTIGWRASKPEGGSSKARCGGTRCASAQVDVARGLSSTGTIRSALASRRWDVLPPARKFRGLSSTGTIRSALASRRPDVLPPARKFRGLSSTGTIRSALASRRRDVLPPARKFRAACRAHDNGQRWLRGAGTRCASAQIDVPRGLSSTGTIRSALAARRDVLPPARKFRAACRAPDIGRRGFAGCAQVPRGLSSTGTNRSAWLRGTRCASALRSRAACRAPARIGRRGFAGRAVPVRPARLVEHLISSASRHRDALRHAIRSTLRGLSSTRYRSALASRRAHGSRSRGSSHNADCDRSRTTRDGGPLHVNREEIPGRRRRARVSDRRDTASSVWVGVLPKRR